MVRGSGAACQTRVDMTTTFAVVFPETNTVVARDYAALAPVAVAFAYTPFSVVQPEAGVAGGFLQLLANTRNAIRDAAVTATGGTPSRGSDDSPNGIPDALILATSAETFWGGVAGNAEFEARLRELTEVPITTGASACDAALRTLDARRIALVTPYQPSAERETRLFFEEAGYEVARVHDLRCANPQAIAAVTLEEMTAALRAVDGDDIDAIVQVGANLDAAQHTEHFESAFAKPFLAINTVTLWHALRSSGLTNRRADAGALFREH